MNLKPLIAGMSQSSAGGGGGGGGLGSVTLTGTPTAGQIIIATSPTAAEWDDETGGAGTDQVPSWTFATGAVSDPIADGTFATDNTAITSTTELRLSNSVIGTANQTLQASPSGLIFILVDSVGECTSFQGTISNTVNGISVTVTSTPITTGTNWSGKYKVMLWPAKQTPGDLGLGTMAMQAADSVDITNGSATLSNLTTGNATITGGAVASSTLTGALPALNGSALTGLTLSQVLTGSGITTFTQFLAVFGITPVVDGTVSPVTSETTNSGITTVLS